LALTGIQPYTNKSVSSNENNQNEQADNAFGLPEGYFSHSARRILLKLEWEEEHRAYPLLSRFKEGTPFAVPAGYFQRNQVQLELLDTPTLLSQPKQAGFSTPDAYFETQQATVLSALLSASDSELQHCPVLGGIDKRNCFKVDEGYFEANERLLNTLLEPSRQARIIDLFFARKSYVAAAMLLMCAGIWLYSVYGRPAVVEGDCGTIACLEKADLMKARVLESADSDELYELVNPGDLEKQLDKKKDEATAGKADSSLDNLDLEDLPDDI